MFRILQAGKAPLYYWQIMDEHGSSILVSSEAFTTKEACKKSIYKVVISIDAHRTIEDCTLSGEATI